MIDSNSISIGGASGYWGDYAGATEQLLAMGQLDYLVYDYLAEITLSIMARARDQDARSGYATDFISSVLKHNLQEIAGQGVKVISNAGGVNPQACAAAARQLIAEYGLDLKVAVVLGDDLLDRQGEFTASEMFSAEAFPATEKILSINAYLGAFPIARALAAGADIIITGRCVDSAVTLAACIHEFGWRADQWDLLAAGTLAGHLIECGTQLTGGNYTDWEPLQKDFHRIGYPVAKVSADGSIELGKPAGTGGCVSVGTVCEQMLYEIGDPQAYIVPDVVCDFSAVTVTRQGEDQVLVRGARGYPAPADYKVSVTFSDGWRGGALYTLYGFDAEQKANCFADNCFLRTRSTLARNGLPDFTETSVEVLGAQSQFGDARSINQAREVVVKIAARHDEAKGIALLLKEIAGLGLSAPPGLCTFAGTRPKPSPVVRLFSFLLPKQAVAISLQLEDGIETFEDVAGGQCPQANAPIPPPVPEQRALTHQLPLIRLAYGRSGDKGNKANIGIIARQSRYLPYIWAALDETRVAQRFAHFIDCTSTADKPVERFYLPGSHAINFLIHDVLGGGGVASLRNDAQGKGFAQLLLDQPIPVPAELARAVMENP